MENLPSRQHHISGGAANKFLQQTEKTVCKVSYHKGINSSLINMFCINIKDKVTETK